MNEIDNIFWVEKYRPIKIEDCILPKRLKSTFEGIRDKQQMINMLLSGSSGTGKTTLAKALCKELDVDWIVINASAHNGIDMIRNTIVDFASTISLGGNGKCVILDEADNLTLDAQKAFRSYIEEFSSNCNFILTCNYPNKLIDAIHSRCMNIEISVKKEEKAQLAMNFFKRVTYILDKEHIEYDNKVVSELIKHYFPDFRRVINELQRYSMTGVIDTGILANIKKTDLNTLIEAIKAKNFVNARQWVADNVDNGVDLIFGKLYTTMYDQLEPSCIGQIIYTLNEYQFKNHFVVDRSLNLTSLIIELFNQCKFK